MNKDKPIKNICTVQVSRRMDCSMIFERSFIVLECSARKITMEATDLVIIVICVAVFKTCHIVNRAIVCL